MLTLDSVTEVWAEPLKEKRREESELSKETDISVCNHCVYHITYS